MAIYGAIYRQLALVRPRFTIVRSFANASGPALGDHDMQLLQHAIRAVEESMRESDHAGVPSDTNKKSTHPSSPRKTMDIKLIGGDCLMLDAFARFCINTGKTLGAHMPGAAPLPLCIQKWAVLSSPHVHKTAWTQLERRTHGKALKVYGMQGVLLKKYIWYIQQHCPPDIQLECMMHEYLSISEIRHRPIVPDGESRNNER